MRSLRILPALLFLLLLGGCVFPSGDELLAAPKPSSNYQSLQTELEKQLAQGVSYASPSEGENRSSIQLADLDNDGVEEAITFFRGATSATSNKFTVAVYRKQDDSYVCTGTIDGRGTALRSVEFPVLEPSGKRGMVLTWRLPGDGTGALTMCDFDENCTPGIILETEYTAMELTDLTGNGAKDLLLITSDTSGKRVARLYQYDNGSMLPAGETATSQGTAAVERMQSGRVQDSKTAVFAEEKVANGAGLTTDIFVYSNDTLRNLALDGEDTASHSTYRPGAREKMGLGESIRLAFEGLRANKMRAVLTMLGIIIGIAAVIGILTVGDGLLGDVNGDGITELPRAVLMAGYKDTSSSDAVYMLDWYAYGIGKVPAKVATTYQNISDAWSLLIDQKWHDRITAIKANDGGLSYVEFFEYRKNKMSIPLFNIYCATGSNREYYAERTDLIQLGQTTQAIYFAKLTNEGEQSELALTGDEIKARFSLVNQAWNN